MPRRTIKPTEEYDRPPIELTPTKPAKARKPRKSLKSKRSKALVVLDEEKSMSTTEAPPIPSQAEIEELIRKTTFEAVHTTLISLGLDPTNPIGMQQRMADITTLSALLASDDFRQDIAYLHKWRQSVEQAANVTLKSVITVIIGGIFTLLVLGFRNWIDKP